MAVRVEEIIALSKLAAAPSSEPQAFYADCLKELREAEIPFLLGGGYAVCLHTGLERASKDLDIFCRAGDYPRILTHLQRTGGYQIEIEDDRWIAKIRRHSWFVDLIFGSTSEVAPVTDRWFDEGCTGQLFGIEVRVLPPTELIWSKLFVQDRFRFDGADIMHVILRQKDRVDWRRLLAYADQHREVLLAHLLNYRFVYPSERNDVPGWLLDELLDRLRRQAELPEPQTKVCRGRHFSRADYLADVTEWGFADVVGAAEMPRGRRM